MTLNNFYRHAESLVEKRAAELEEPLRPILDELGLKINVSHDSYHSEIQFNGKPTKGVPWFPFSPIRIFFDEDYFTQKKPHSPWSGAYLAVESFTSRSLGKSGYKHWRDWDKEYGPTRYDITLEGKEMYRWLRRRLRSRGVVSIEKDGPEYIQNDYLVNAYFRCVGLVRGVSVMTFAGEEGTEEALTCQSVNRERLHFVFRHTTAHVFVDGENRGCFNALNADDTARIMRWVQSGLPNCEFKQSDRPPPNPYGTP